MTEQALESEMLQDLGMQAKSSVPGAHDSTLLVLHASLTLLRLGKSEALQMLAAVPELLALSLCRLPALLLTWISFGVLVACSVYAFTDNLVLAAGSVFALQLALSLLLEQRIRRLLEKLGFAETRKGLAALQAALKERLGHGAG